LAPQWLELGLREALRQDGGHALEALFNDANWRLERDQTEPGEKCYAARPTTVDTLFGPLCVRRNYYTDGQGGGRAPLDEALGMVEGCTPALARLMCRAGAVEHYEAAAASLHEYSGLTVHGRRIQRMVRRLGPQMAALPAALIRLLPLLAGLKSVATVPLILAHLACCAAAILALTAADLRRFFGNSSSAGVGTSPPAMESISLCSVSICSLMARIWRSWVVVNSVMFMGEVLTLGGGGGQAGRWPVRPSARSPLPPSRHGRQPGSQYCSTGYENNGSCGQLSEKIRWGLVNPWRLMCILEERSPSFQKLFYPEHLHYQGDWRTVRAIEENWPAYFPTRKECRGPEWSLVIGEDKPLYKPSQKAQRKLAQWKTAIYGTIAEGRAYRSDMSWKRFFQICRQSPRLRPHVQELTALADFLVHEESMWPPPGPADHPEPLLRKKLAILLSANSPYLHADPQRLRFLKSGAPALRKIQMIYAMRSLLDGPLMTLAVLQKCADKSSAWYGWLDLRDHIKAIVKKPAKFTFRKTWFDYALRLAGATKPSGKPFPREWARQLLVAQRGEKEGIEDPGSKAIEVNAWLKGKKLPSIRNIEQSWNVVATLHASRIPDEAAGRDVWIFSWMIALLMEKHYEEIRCAFKRDKVKFQRRQIQRYYRRFFHHLKTVLPA
jgi:hypothetical protein